MSVGEHRSALQPPDEPTPYAAVAETTMEEEKILSCSGCANAGMKWLAQRAQQAMKEEDIDYGFEPVVFKGLFIFPLVLTDFYVLFF